MADHSFDCEATKNLLCTKTSNLLCFDNVDHHHQTHETDNQNLVTSSSRNGGRSQPLICLPFPSEENLVLMVAREKEHLPKDDYLIRLRSGDLDLDVRREALDWVWKAHAHYSFGALSICLAINYLDRFLSVYELPRGKTWTVQLLAVACTSLATKMEEINVPLIVDLQVGDPKFVFEGKTIQRMELLVLSTLNWRMKACTPCSFIDYFLRQMKNDEIQSGPLISRSIQLILSTLRGIDFLEFRPSEIAAAVATCVSGEMQAVDIDKAVSCFIHVEKERLQKCVELIQDLTLVSGSSSRATNEGISGSSSTITNVGSNGSVTESPIGVLDAGTCLSYKYDERTVGSCPNSSHTSPDIKRRKLDTGGHET